MSKNRNPDNAGQPTPAWGGYSQQDYVQPHVQQHWQGNSPYDQQYQQPQWQQPYAPQPQFAPRKPWMARHKFLTGLGALLLLFIFIGVGANLGKSPSQSTGAPAFVPTTQAAGAPATSAAAAVKHTVTFDVTGSPADITYGPAGTSVSGTVPLHVTKPLGDPLYYSLEVQLQGGGTVTCKIRIDGKVIAESVASGGYNIAMCEIGKDPLTGQWADDNAA